MSPRPTSKGAFAAQHHHVGVLADPRLVRGEALAELRRLLLEVREHAVEAAIRRDQLRRSLLADTRHSREVVGRIAPQRGVLRVLRRRDACAVEDARLVVEHVVGHTPPVVQHRDVWVLDELVRVPVAGDDDDVETEVTAAGGERRDEVVGLVASEVHDLDAEGVDDLTHQPHLLPQDVGGCLALGLVLGHRDVAERRLWTVEQHDDTVGPLVAEQVDEHRREAEDCVRHLTRRRRHVRGQGEERPVRQRVAVEQEELGHWSSVRPVAVQGTRVPSST